MNRNKKTIVVGMSGGVDSSVAAYLLKQQGYNVVGLFMKNWQDFGNLSKCSAEEDFEDVKRVCNILQIPYYTVNFEKEYKQRVFNYFLSQYEKGRTPNPDVLCNKEIKFGPFLEQAEKLGAFAIATGHYAKKVELNGKYYLAKATDLNKDQSYFLHQLNQNQLRKVVFPLADLKKSEVRLIAQNLKFSTAEKKDSTGICFIGERNFKNFLKEFFPIKKGDIITQNNEVIGQHEGLMFYTIGQRRGLGIGGQSGKTGGRWFVLAKDLECNRLIVSQEENCQTLYTNFCECENFNWIPEKPNIEIFDCFAKFRYRQPDQKVTVILGDKQKFEKLSKNGIEKNEKSTKTSKIKGLENQANNQIKNETKNEISQISSAETSNFQSKNKTEKVYIKFHKPQRAITPGQYAVLYDKNGFCLGGGEII